MNRILQWLRPVVTFGRKYWLGTVLILAATLIFFWPVVVRIDSYSEGGDAMFNAWTLARDHHCLMFDGCPDYANGNIFFPHKFSMFYSETQLSAGFLTLPLYWLNDNPLFAYNIWMVASFFFSGWFMYLLAKRLSKNNELVSILAGLVFEFAPFKMAAVSHLQSLSIFYLPLAALLMLKFLDTARKRYLAGLFVVMTLLFYASWYQAVFALIGIGLWVAVLLIAKQIDWRPAVKIGGAVAGAGLMVLPLALQYLQFSRSTDANFSIEEQVKLSSSVIDYVLPHFGTLVGKIFYHLNPHTHPNAYNIDSFSYHGIVLYVLAAVLLLATAVAYRRARQARTTKAKASAEVVRRRKTMLVYVSVFVVVAVAGFIISLGPFLKLRAEAGYELLGNSVKIVFPLPWLAVDVLVPQLQFIRAIGRASVLTLFGLACLLAYLPVVLSAWQVRRAVRIGVIALVAALVVFELMPAHRVLMAQGSYAYNLHIPAIYKLVKSDPEINNLIVLRSMPDYPDAPFAVARTEDVLWAGYHNKNIFNGYSGYTPPTYFRDLADFTNLDASDIPKMKKLGLRYVIIDKQLSKGGSLVGTARSLFPAARYEDNRYILFKIP